MAKTITLTQGKVAVVDDEDFERLSARSWQYSKGYAVSGSHSSDNHVRMHRFVLGLFRHDGKLVDHINGNKLDNRKSNLRVCDNSRNQANRGVPRNNTSGYKGVVYHKGKRKWMASLEYGGKAHFLGYYRTPEAAAMAYNAAAKELFGDFARLNAVEANHEPNYGLF